MPLEKQREKEEKDARAAIRQLVKDLKGVNPTVKKALNKKIKPVVIKVKTATPTVLKTRKASIKAKSPTKSTAKEVVVAPIKEVVTSRVAAINRKGRAIRLPQRYI
jgi:N-acyl-L-homoserine lactone synthetase